MSNSKNDIVKEFLNDMSESNHKPADFENDLGKLKDFFTNNRFSKLSVFKEIINISEERDLNTLYENTLQMKNLIYQNNSNITYSQKSKILSFLYTVIYEIERHINFDNEQKNFDIFIASKKDEIEQALQETKQIKTELTAILGVFTAIVIGFVGQMVFSSSLLSNMTNVNPFELAFVISALTFGFINLIYILVFFIYKIIFKNNYNSNTENYNDKNKTNDSAHIENKENSDNDNTNTTNKSQEEKPVDDDLKSLKIAWVFLNFFTMSVAIITFIMWVKT